ncbi:DUF1707 SHOCT-like domain-containing protein [Actinomycetes bacterium M1A6_2h]
MAAGSNHVIRARDIDRALVATALDNAYADGQLTFDEHRDRLEKARNAQTLGQLHSLAADLQAEVPLPEPEAQPRRSPRGRAIGVGAAVVVVVLAVAVYLGARESTPDAQPPTEPTRPIPTVDGTVVPIVARPFDFWTAAGLTDFRARFLNRYGDPTVSDVTLYPADNRATLDRLVDGGRTRSVDVRGGFDDSGDTALLASGYQSFDISQIDVVALASAMAGAGAAVEVPGAAVTHVVVRNMGTPEILVFAADADNRGGYVQTDFAGNVTRVATYRP